jgi:hypothetical protein
MSGRPCNPGSDLRQLWQALLGKNTPFPQCGVPDKQENGDTRHAERPNEPEDAAGAPRHR